METAFMKALSHLLSKNYKYIIIADRGFGNQRFIKLCQDLGFEYCLRLRVNLIVKCQNKLGYLKNVIKNDREYYIWVQRWQKMCHIVKTTKGNKTWYILNNKRVAKKTVVKIYAQRFKIERLFKLLKSAGFDIENLKIRKYERYKKMLALSLVAKVITMMFADFSQNKFLLLKKKSQISQEIYCALTPLPVAYLKHMEHS